MSEKFIAFAMVALVAVLGAVTVVELRGTDVSGQSYRISPNNPLDWGVYPQYQYPLTGYKYQISIGKCNVQGACRVVAGFDPRCAYNEALFRNGFIDRCLAPGEGVQYPYCSHKPVGGLQSDNACSPDSRIYTQQKDCVCL